MSCKINALSIYSSRQPTLGEPDFLSSDRCEKYRDHEPESLANTVIERLVLA